MTLIPFSSAICATSSNAAFINGLGILVYSSHASLVKVFLPSLTKFSAHFPLRRIFCAVLDELRHTV